MSYNDFDIRMKSYERIYTEDKVIPHIPIIARIDGKCFHNYTKSFERPFDSGLKLNFQLASLLFKKEFHYDLAYGQSDEVSFLFYHPNLRTQEDFEGKLFKLCSIMASAFTANFNMISESENLAYFDCRVFQLPVTEVTNYFKKKKKDSVRNSIQMVGQSKFSHKELNGKSCNNIQEMLFSKYQINWNDYPIQDKRGWCIKQELDTLIPDFKDNRDYIESILKAKEIID